MEERDKLIEKLIKEKGGTKQQYLHLLDAIAYHESDKTFDPKLSQYGGGPGRGKYQFEKGTHGGAITAAKRTATYYKENNLSVPKWLEKASKGDDLDVSDLSSNQQDILFLGNMRKHPKADFSNLWKGEQSIPDFWANYHWAGDKKDRAKRIQSFNSDLAEFETNPKKKIPTNSLERPEMVKDNTLVAERITPNPNINNNSQPNNLDFASNIQAYGGMNDIKSHVRELNSFNTGGSHSSNRHGGIPMGVGSNGKMNTVEQGETSYNFKDQGQFIFSDRINVNGSITGNPSINKLELGGPTDPVEKPIDITMSPEVNKARDFVGNWNLNPVTKQRLSNNLNIPLEEASNILNKSVGDLSKTKVIKYPNNPNLTYDADFTPYNKEIGIYKEPSEAVLTHELTHSLGDIDKQLSKKVQTDFGVIPTSGVTDPNEREHIKYLNRNGEFYPRLMEMRQFLNINPGEEITDDQINQLQNDERVGKMFKYYKPEQIKLMLNTLASNSNRSRNNTNLV